MELEWIEAMVKKHEREKKVSRVIAIATEPAVAKGNNYCSDIHRTKLNVVLGSGKKTTKSVIIKCLPGLEAHRKFITEHGVFKKEIQMYTTTLEHLESVMEDYKDPDEKLWCELIGYRCYDVIMLEDLNELNYRVASRRDMLDLDHTLLAIRGLAKYHALTKVILREGYTSKTDYTTNFFCQDETTIKMAFVSSMEVLAEVMKADWGAEWNNVSDRLTALSSTVVSTMLELGKVDEARFNVINHGDCWTNNMMFKYDSQDNPVGLKFIDFQMTHYNSFAFDVTYFLQNSVKGDTRRENFEEIIRAYYDSLVGTLRRYDTPVEALPTLEHIRAEMERLRPFSLFLLCSMTPLMTADGGDAVDMEKALENIDNPKDGINTQIYKDSHYRNMSEKDFREYSRIGLL